MKNWKKPALGLILAAGLLAGCGKPAADGASTAVTVNEENVCCGTAEFLLRYQQAETYSMMQAYGMASDASAFWNTETAEDESGKTQTYGEYLKTTVEDLIVEGVLLRQHADEYGVTFPKELEEDLNAAVSELASVNKEALAKIGTTEDNIREAMMLTVYPTLMREAVTADVDTEVSDEEAAQSTITYARLQIPEVTDDTEEAADETASSSEEEVTNIAEKAKADMEAFLAAVKASDDPATVDFNEIKNEINEDIFVFDYSYGKEGSVLPQEVMDAAATLSDGQVYDKLITTSDGYYYVIRMDAVFDREETDAEKEAIVASRRSEAYNEKIDEWKNAAKITWTDAWKNIKVTDSDRWVAIQTTTAEDETVSVSSAAEEIASSAAE
ncbi:MAG: hypothetical protein HUJ73_07785 [Eubacterium sp.]|nr:hypothetical protein [Eubacterium sp.]